MNEDNLNNAAKQRSEKARADIKAGHFYTHEKVRRTLFEEQISTRDSAKETRTL